MPLLATLVKQLGSLVNMMILARQQTRQKPKNMYQPKTPESPARLFITYHMIMINSSMSTTKFPREPINIITIVNMVTATLPPVVLWK